MSLQMENTTRSLQISKEILEDFYRNHHENNNKYGFQFCQHKRGPIIKRWIGTGKRILDLGCREGTLTKNYVDGNEIIGVDIDKKALEIAERNLKIKTHWLDLNSEFPFEKNSFDVIVACEFLEHIYLIKPVLKNCFEVLKPNGLFIGSIPNSFRIRNRIRFLMGREFEKDPTHVRTFSYKGLIKTLSEYFRDIEIIPLSGSIFLKFIRVSPRMPFYLNRLFAIDLLFKSVK